MYKIKLMNKISKVGTDLFGQQYQIGEDIENEDGILVRSASLHDYQFPSTLLAIARAGAGVNNIPIDQCSEQGCLLYTSDAADE